MSEKLLHSFLLAEDRHGVIVQMRFGANFVEKNADPSEVEIIKEAKIVAGCEDDDVLENFIDGIECVEFKNLAGNNVWLEFRDSDLWVRDDREDDCEHCGIVSKGKHGEDCLFKGTFNEGHTY